MLKVRVSNHAKKRWKQRVDIKKKWTKSRIAGYISTRFLPKLRQGIKPYTINQISYYLFFTGEINEKLVFSVLTPDSSGLWAGWSVVTVITDDQIDSINTYYDVLYQEVKANEQKSSQNERLQEISRTPQAVEKEGNEADPIPNEVSKGGLMDLIRIKENLREEYPGLPNYMIDRIAEEAAEKVAAEDD